MSGLTDVQWEQVAATCAANVPVLADSLAFCFDRRFRIELGRTAPWTPSVMPPDFSGPGLILAFEAAGQTLLCLIPETLPLPAWCVQPGLSEAARLRTLAQEWAVNLFPAGLSADGSSAQPSVSLADSIRQAGPLAGAQTLELRIFDAEPAAESSPPAVCLLLGPATRTPTAETSRSRPPLPAGGPKPTAAPAPAAAPPKSKPPFSAAEQRLRRLHKLPVTLSVRLAEKKIEMGQLLALTPGGLITFNKSCEDLLDLYVNNRLYCRGEAVKIGEKFGLKVNELPAAAKPE